MKKINVDPQPENNYGCSTILWIVGGAFFLAGVLFWLGGVIFGEDGREILFVVPIAIGLAFVVIKSFFQKKKDS